MTSFICDVCFYTILLQLSLHSLFCKQKGPNKTPVAAICLTSLLTMAFIFIGQVNVLAPIVTINFMLTYSFIDYSYFSVAMTYNLQVRKSRVGSTKRTGLYSSGQNCKALMAVTHQGYGTERDMEIPGTLLEFTRDMDQIFPLPGVGQEEVEQASVPGLRCNDRKSKAPAKKMLMDSFGLDLNSNTFANDGGEEVDPTPPGEAVHPQERPGEQSLDPGEVKQDKPLSRRSSIQLDHPPGSQSQNTGELLYLGY